MKRFSFLIMLLALFAVTSCIEEFGEVGEPIDHKAQAIGTWKVTTMMQRDLITPNPDVAVVDITNAYAFSEYTLTLNTDGSFATSNPGNAPEFIMSSGTWVFDDPEFPAAIMLTSGGSTTRLDLGSVNSLNDRNELEVSFLRKVLIPNEQGDEEVTAIAYEYTLSKNQ